MEVIAFVENSFLLRIRSKVLSPFLITILLYMDCHFLLFYVNHYKNCLYVHYTWMNVFFVREFEFVCVCVCVFLYSNSKYLQNIQPLICRYYILPFFRGSFMKGKGKEDGIILTIENFSDFIKIRFLFWHLRQK